MRRTSSILVVAGFVTVCTGCGQNGADRIERVADRTEKVADKIGFGSLENGVYKNEYFGMTVTLPEGWYALDDEARKAVMQKGEKMVAGRDKNLQAAIEATELTTVNLLTAYFYCLISMVQA